MTDGPDIASNPDFIDFQAYARDARYCPPPALVARPDWDMIRTGWGGQGFGFDELADRAARAAGKI